MSRKAGLVGLLLAIWILCAPACPFGASSSAAQGWTLWLPAILKSHGLATMTGELYEFRGVPIRGTTFYITQNQWPMIVGPRPGDVVGKTDYEGRFALDEIPVGEYFMLVWAPYKWVYVPKARDDLRPRRFGVKAGVTHDLGRVEMIWP